MFPKLSSLVTDAATHCISFIYGDKGISTFITASSPYRLIHFKHRFESVCFLTLPTSPVIADLIGNLHFFELLLMMLSRLPVEPAMTERVAMTGGSNETNVSSFLS